MKTALTVGIYSFFCIWGSIWNALAEEKLPVSLHSWTEDGLVALGGKAFLPQTAQPQPNGKRGWWSQMPCLHLSKIQTCPLFRAPTSELYTSRTTHLSRLGRLRGRSKKSTCSWCPERRNGKPGCHILICPDCSWRHIRKSNMKWVSMLMKKKKKKKLNLLILT